MLISSNKDFARLSTIDQTELLLQIFREESDEAGRLVCSPNFKEWLKSQLLKREYRLLPVYSDLSYASAFAMIKNLGLIERLSRAHAAKPAILRVDLKTSITQAKEAKKTINTYFAADLIEALKHIEGNDSVRYIIEAQREKSDAEKDRIINEQKQEIARLTALIKDTLQEAQNFAKNTRKKLNQA